MNKLNKEILKNIIQPLHFLTEDINEAKNLYNERVLNNILTREQHTELHNIFQKILNNLKVLANRLENYNYRDIWLNKIAHGYSHTQNFSFQYFYEGGEYICEHYDVAPFYESKIIKTFDPEEAINKKIERIKIVLYLQQKKDKSKKSNVDKLVYESNSFLEKISNSAHKINQKFQLDF